jgi:superfamily II DNA/RNA helicase
VIDTGASKTESFKINVFRISLYKVSNQQLIDSNISQKPTIHLYEYEENNSTYDYTEDIYNVKYNKNKLRIIKELIKDQTLIVVNELDHLEFLFKELIVDYRVGTIHGTNEFNDINLQNFKDNKIQILISTVVLKEGVNIKNINTLKWKYRIS